jgi:hypothetical protein
MIAEYGCSHPRTLYYISGITSIITVKLIEWEKEICITMLRLELGLGRKSYRRQAESG